MDTDEPSTAPAETVAATPPRRTGVRAWFERNRELIKDYVQSIGILAAAAWGVYQFYYVEIYRPAHALPEVVLSSNLKELGRNDKFITLLATINVHNKSSVQVHVISSSYSVLGYAATYAPDTGEETYY